MTGMRCQPAADASVAAGTADSRASAEYWLRVISVRLSVADLDYSYRLLRGWLHTVRDWLSVAHAMELADGLPDLLREMFYEGWEVGVSAPPAGAVRFVTRFGNTARISVAEVHFGGAATTIALRALLPAGRLDATLERLPPEVRRVLAPVRRFGTPAPAAAAQAVAPTTVRHAVTRLRVRAAGEGVSRG